MLIKGKDLNKSQRNEVFINFVYRFHSIGPDKYYKTEQDWLNDHAFYFVKDGSRLSARHKHCVPAFMADPIPNNLEIKL